MWVYSSWSECSVSCGEGTQSRKATCQIGSRIVDEDQCYQVNKDSISKPCSSPCPEWVADGWSECSASCGGGKRTRLYHCELNSFKISDRRCDSSLKPYDSEECNLDECPTWSVGSWQSCSKSCDGGSKKRYFYKN